MSTLTQARDWARTMQVSDHRPDCQIEQTVYTAFPDLVGIEVVRPHPACPGCVTESDRRLWKQLGDEYDRYLGSDTSWGLRREGGA